MTEEAAAQGREEKPESEGRKLGSRGKDHSLTTVGEGPAKHESIYPFEEGYPTTIEFARAVHVKSWEDPSLNGQDVCAPPIIYKRIVDLGEANAKRPLVFSIPKGVHAGVFIGIGGVLVGAIGGSIAAGFQSFDDPSLDPGFQRLANLSKLGNFIAGIFGLPLSILAIVVTGADLFTGNCLTSVCAIVEQRISVYQYLRMLILSWCTNLAGNLIIAGLAHAGNVVGPNGEAFFINLAKEKTNQGGADPSGFNAVITKAILANVLIALAIAWSLTASSFTSKFFATLLPTSAFVAMDLEHTVANMIEITMGLINTDEVTWFDLFFRNLWITTIGNWIGGGIVLPLPLMLAHGSPGERLQAMLDRLAMRLGRMKGPSGRQAEQPPSHTT